MAQGLMRIEQRLDNIEKRMENLEARAGAYEPRFQAIESRLQGIEGPRMDGIGMDDVESRLLASSVIQPLQIILLTTTTVLTHTRNIGDARALRLAEDTLSFVSQTVTTSDFGPLSSDLPRGRPPCGMSQAALWSWPLTLRMP
ncbi:hypothetical protein NM208_g9188 [Fusarium decemcellulare]|uniref:Uncharacterized protein n=1 Tax=Fusarium decemcellulare TaxID=57161 RepID=A0ACC1S2H8_9HYPO|nr:hypothetical protein NM208_g9188 [Fusarium decemcellulare]